MQRTRRTGMDLGCVVIGALAVFAVAGCHADDPLAFLEAELPTRPRDLGPPQRVFAKRFVTPVRSAPSPEGVRLGYLRAGALLHSTTTEPVGYEGCEGGWYELDTGGFACRQRDILVFSGDRLPELRARQPDRDADMPYEYVTVRRKTPLYKRIPKADELYAIPPGPEDGGVEASATLDPETPATGAVVDNPLVLRILQPGFYVALDRRFERDGETYWRTQQNGFVPAKNLRRKDWSRFRGQALDGGRWNLPVAVTRREETAVYRLNDRGKLKPARERLPSRSWLAVQSRRRINDNLYLVVGNERLVREAEVMVIEPTAPPEGVGEGDRWIDVDLQRQIVVAYDWKQPRYVTLVSSGRSKAPSPEQSNLTPKGLHRIRGKHLTSTMDNDEPGEPPYSLEDVPYVMYFKGAYAFHSAFWHDRFGRPRSHGCINLAPYDAKWLFNWAGPDLLDTWHGGMANEDNPGTWVHVHGETP